MPIFLDIALGLPSGGPFQYSAPQALRDRATIGKRVFVSVRSRRMVGTIVGFSESRAVEDVREIESVIDEFPVLDTHFIELTRWLSEYYFCSWGQAIEAALPAPFKKGKLFMKSRSAKWSDRTETAEAVEFPLTPSQTEAFQAVLSVIKKHETGVFLLHGITGSGKTEIYMHLIRELLAENRGSIVLVPEISLTPQTVNRFHSRFGNGLAVIHSRLSQGQRVEEWHRIRKGEAKVVVGARSAVFSPVRDLGLIVIDEEHDTSYKQEETPRYQTRDVAAKRAELEKAALLLGTATPSLETFFASHVGTDFKPAPMQEIKCLRLSERISNRPLPIVEIVDMRREIQNRGEKIFSSLLEKNIRECLSKKEQAMLLLNRRGFATYLHCSSCGYVETCPNCRITLAYHYDKAALFCHVCHFRSAPARLCPACQKHHLHYFGMGTQKVESEAGRLFPGARVGRMDSDSMSKKDSHETILSAFRKREIDILIGTQMIAKGHDFPHVSLVGVVSADTALHIPDFRAAERTFGLLTQVAGRAGRGDIPGKVVIQTYVPHHYSIQSAKDHDYFEFYKKEIVFRKELRMPPYSHLVKLVLGGAAEKEVVRQILELAKLLRSRLAMPLRGTDESVPLLAGGFTEPSFRVLGPAPCLVSKEKGYFRWNLYLQGPGIEEIRPLLIAALKDFKKTKVTLTVDVDPQ